MVKFVVDSTFGLTDDYVKQHDIKVVSLKLVLDDEVLDGAGEENWRIFFDKLANTKSFPTTSQPSPQDFEDAISEIYLQDKDAGVIVLTIASCFSGTYNGACLASKAFEGKKLAVVDSKCASLAEKLLLEECVERVENGATFEEILELIPTLQQKTKIQFIPETMEYLKRGGRVGKLSAVIADVLKIKPVFEVKNNIITVTKKVLGLGKGIVEMIANIPKNVKRLYVCYIHDNANVSRICERLKSVLNIENPKIECVDPVFGCHVGIGAIGIATMEE